MTITRVTLRCLEDSALALWLVSGPERGERRVGAHGAGAAIQLTLRYCAGDVR